MVKILGLLIDTVSDEEFVWINYIQSVDTSLLDDISYTIISCPKSLHDTDVFNIFLGYYYFLHNVSGVDLSQDNDLSISKKTIDKIDMYISKLFK